MCFPFLTWNTQSTKMKEKKTTSSTDWKWISAQGNGHGRDRARSYLIFCIWACSKSVAWDSSKICNIFDDRYECECNLCILFTFITPKISIPMQNYSAYTHIITYFCHDFSFLVLCVVFFFSLYLHFKNKKSQCCCVHFFVSYFLLNVRTYCVNISLVLKRKKS